MKKPKQKTKTTQSKKSSAKPKPTVEQLNDDERRRLLFAHKRKLKPLLESEKEAKAAVIAAFEAAKSQGIPKKELKLAISLETPDGEEALRLDLERSVRIARWTGAGVQLDMFGVPKMKPAEKYFEDGKRARLDDQARKPPSHLSTTDHKHWFEGYDSVAAAKNTERAREFQKPSDAAEKVLPLMATNGGTEAVDSLTH